MRRIPRYRAYSSGTPGGIDNPLGERALYLHRDGHDTRVCIHGSNDPMTVGQAVLSGCVRLTNDNIIDLYGRVALGTAVMVRP